MLCTVDHSHDLTKSPGPPSLLHSFDFLSCHWAVAGASSPVSLQVTWRYRLSACWTCRSWEKESHKPTRTAYPNCLCRIRGPLSTNYFNKSEKHPSLTDLLYIYAIIYGKKKVVGHGRRFHTGACFIHQESGPTRPHMTRLQASLSKS